MTHHAEPVRQRGTLRVLNLEDRVEDAELLEHEVRRAGFASEWTRVQTRAAFLDALHTGPDIVLADYSLPELTALDALDELRGTGLDIPAIVVTGVMSEQACVESLRHGAIDYLLKDRLTRIGPAIEHALAERRLRAERRAADRQARRIEAMLCGVVANAPSAIYVKDRDGRYLVANRRLEQLLGVAHGAAAGRTDSELNPGELAERLADRDGACLRRGVPDRREETFPVGGQARAFLSVRYPIHADGGETDAIGGIYTDVTAMKRTEADLRSARAQLRRQAAALEQDNLDLKQLDRVKSQLIESVSHELRTPLAIINGAIEMMLDGDVGTFTDPEREVVASVERAGNRLFAVISDLLAAFQMDRGGFALNVRPAAPADVVRRAVNTVEPMIHQAELDLTVDLPPDLPQTPMDGDQIGRVLLNLITNAIKFSPRGGAIAVTARVSGDELVLSVRDHGSGIPQAEQATVFLRFRRGSSALRQAVPGTGLGLAISKELVEQHGGWIDLESRAGEGTTVTFGLPRHPPAGAVQPAPSATAGTGPASGPSAAGTGSASGPSAAGGRSSVK